jgi:hypothetical protein
MAEPRPVEAREQKACRMVVALLRASSVAPSDRFEKEWQDSGSGEVSSS